MAACPLCASAVPREGLERHLREELLASAWACRLCDAAFLTEADAKDHFEGAFASHPGQPVALERDEDAEKEARLRDLLAAALSPAADQSLASQSFASFSLVDQSIASEQSVLLHQPSQGPMEVDEDSVADESASQAPEEDEDETLGDGSLMEELKESSAEEEEAEDSAEAADSLSALSSPASPGAAFARAVEESSTTREEIADESSQEYDSDSGADDRDPVYMAKGSSSDDSEAEETSGRLSSALLKRSALEDVKDEKVTYPLKPSVELKPKRPRGRLTKRGAGKGGGKREAAAEEPQRRRRPARRRADRPTERTRNRLPPQALAETQVRCRVCALPCQRGSFKRHVLCAHMQTLPFHCRTCSYANGHKNLIKKHVANVHDQQPPLEEGYTEMQFTDGETRQMMEDCFGREALMTRATKPPPTALDRICPACGATFINRRDHAATHLAVPIYLCDACPFTCNLRWQIKRHSHKKTTLLRHSEGEKSWTKSEKGLRKLDELVEALSMSSADDRLRARQIPVPSPAKPSQAFDATRLRLDDSFEVAPADEPTGASQTASSEDESAADESLLDGPEGAVDGPADGAGEPDEDADQPKREVGLEKLQKRRKLMAGEKYCRLCGAPTHRNRWAKHAAADHLTDQPFACKHCNYTCLLMPVIQRHLLSSHSVTSTKDNADFHHTPIPDIQAQIRQKTEDCFGEFVKPTRPPAKPSSKPKRSHHKKRLPGAPRPSGPDPRQLFRAKPGLVLLEDLPKYKFIRQNADGSYLCVSCDYTARMSLPMRQHLKLAHNEFLPPTGQADAPTAKADAEKESPELSEPDESASPEKPSQADREEEEEGEEREATPSKIPSPGPRLSKPPVRSESPGAEDPGGPAEGRGGGGGGGGGGESDEDAAGPKPPDREYTCALCGFNATKFTRNQHVVAAHLPEEVFRCKDCAFETRRFGCLRRHRLSSHGDTKKAFPPAERLAEQDRLMEECFPGTYRYGRHSFGRKFHKAPDPNAPLDGRLKDNRQWMCSECGIVVEKERRLHHISLRHHEAPTLRCRHCPYQLKGLNSAGMKLHARGTHGDIGAFEDGREAAKAQLKPLLSTYFRKDRPVGIKRPVG